MRLSWGSIVKPVEFKYGGYLNRVFINSYGMYTVEFWKRGRWYFTESVPIDGEECALGNGFWDCFYVELRKRKLEAYYEQSDE